MTDCDTGNWRVDEKGSSVILYSFCSSSNSLQNIGARFYAKMTVLFKGEATYWNTFSNHSVPLKVLLYSLLSINLWHTGSTT